MEDLNSMVKYKINLIFNDKAKSLNDILTKTLKIELEKKFKTTCKIPNLELPFMHTHYSQKEGSSNK